MDFTSEAKESGATATLIAQLVLNQVKLQANIQLRHSYLIKYQINLTVVLDLNLKFNTSDLDKDVTTEIPEEEHNEIDDENQSGTAIDEGNIGIIKILRYPNTGINLNEIFKVIESVAYEICYFKNFQKMMKKIGMILEMLILKKIWKNIMVMTIMRCMTTSICLI